MPDVSVVIGTRPEAIKCAPVILELRNRGITTRVVATGQHPELARDALAAFGLAPDTELSAMGPGGLSALASRMLAALERELRDHTPRQVIVQGDTTSTLCGALAAFHEGVPCCHIEAGLRSGRRDAPWPEEINRILVSCIATRHYAPTAGARENLLAEGIADDTITVTGQTGVDAALHVARRQSDDLPHALIGHLERGRRLCSRPGTDARTSTGDWMGC
jgi:UDP-N-acetylglucosamine 2-epimerase (non-hydrolysing)